MKNEVSIYTGLAIAAIANVASVGLSYLTKKGIFSSFNVKLSSHTFQLTVNF